MALVKRFEGLRLHAVALAQGGFVIGHGHVAAADPGRAIAAEEAHALLLFDLSRLAARIEPLLLAPTTPAQFDALLSFAFGVGVEAFGDSVVLRRLNAGAYLDAAAAIELWRCAQIGGEAQVIDVLVRRRAVEKARFLEPPQGFAPAPSATLQPQVDLHALEMAQALSGDDRPVYGAAGEAAPSAALAVVAALSARFERLMREEPEPPPLAQAPPEPEPEPPAKVVAFAPTRVIEESQAPSRDPVPGTAPVEASSVAPPPAVADVDAMSPPTRPLRSGPRPEATPEPRVSPPSLRGPAFVLGLLGLGLFVFAVLKTYQAPSLAWLALGLVAVAAMIPASLFLIGPRRSLDD